MLHYGAAKAALIAYSKGLATELAAAGVRVNTITPGYVQTPGADKVREDLAAGFGIDVATINSAVPLGRIGRPAEIAEAVASGPPLTSTQPAPRDARERRAPKEWGEQPTIGHHRRKTL